MLSAHQHKQLEVINEIERQVASNTLGFSTVAAVEDFVSDPRLTITSVHFPSEALKLHIRTQLISPLQQLDTAQYFYDDDSLHMTIKNVRVIADPPTFTEADVQKAREVFSRVIPQHRAFHVYFYRLMVFPHSLSLIGTTDPALDSLVTSLDQGLGAAGIHDDKVYVNTQYFFSNMTLARFRAPVSAAFRQKVATLSHNVQFAPYLVNTISLVTGNAAMKRLRIVDEWFLQNDI